MVGPQTLIGLAIAGAVVAAVVFFRKELGETGGYLGSGLTSLSSGISSILSPKITPVVSPTFKPTIGLDIVGSAFGFGAPTAKTEVRTGSSPLGVTAPKTVDNVTVTPYNRETSDLTSRYRTWMSTGR